MKIKALGALAIGAAIGYAMNSSAGREKLAQLKARGKNFLGNPEVQAKTADLAEKAREKASGLPDPVQKVANTTIDAAKKATNRPVGDPTPESPTDPTAPGDRPPPAGGVPGTAPASSTDPEFGTADQNSDQNTDQDGPTPA